MSLFEQIQDHLRNQRYSSKEADDPYNSTYLSNHADWFQKGILTSYSQFQELKAEFPHVFAVAAALNQGPEDQLYFFHWLVLMNEFELAKSWWQQSRPCNEINLDCIASLVLCQGEWKDIEDFTIQMLLQWVHNNDLWCPEILLGAIKNRRTRVLDQLLKMGVRISSCTIRDILKLEGHSFEEKKELVKQIRFHRGNRPFQFNFISDILHYVKSDQEREYWMDLSIQITSDRDPIHLFHSIYLHGPRYFSWFKEHGWQVSTMQNEFLSYPSTKPEDTTQKLATLQQFKSVFHLSPNCYSLLKALQSGLDLEIVQYIWDNLPGKDKLPDSFFRQLLGSWQRPYAETSLTERALDAERRPKVLQFLEPRLAELRIWLFANLKDQVEKFWQSEAQQSFRHVNGTYKSVDYARGCRISFATYNFFHSNSKWFRDYVREQRKLRRKENNRRRKRAKATRARAQR